MTDTLSTQLKRLSAATDHLRLPDREDFDVALQQVREIIAVLNFRLSRRDGDRALGLRLLCGPSGGGKSSLFNAIVGHSASKVSSVERPATRGAICAVSPNVDAELVMPTLARIDGTAQPGSAANSLVHLQCPLLVNQILVDAPDYDSRELRNREMVELILPWADEVVFVTSMERYADRSAIPFLKRLASLGTPTIAVINKAEGNLQEVLKNFEAKVYELSELRPKSFHAIPRQPSGIDPQLALIEDLRRNPPDIAAGLSPLIRELGAPATTTIIPQLLTWRRDVDSLEQELEGIWSIEETLRDDQRVRELEEYEATSKFWLRYSPRGVLKGLRELARDPGRIFRGDDVPSEPDEEALLKLVLDQAEDVCKRMQIRAREILKRHRPGRILMASPLLTAAEDEKEALELKLRPIAHRLHDFGRERIATFKREWSQHRQGFFSRTRIWAIDKVLRLLSLCLTVAVLPPLIWELLRFIGHPAFTNEVTAEFHRARAAFRDAMAEIETDQIRRYLDAIDELGPTAAAVEDFQRLLPELLKTEAAQ